MAKTYLISRTDSIGDVVLTLPMAGILKKMDPGCKVAFLGKSYTQAVLEACESVDDFYDWSEVEYKDIVAQPALLTSTGADVIIHVFPRKDIAVAALKSAIPLRIGSTGRLWHYWTCNKLVRLSRRNSEMHEAQLNLVLLNALGFHHELSISQIYPYIKFNQVQELDPRIKALLTPDKKNVILHPLSKGSAREWGMENFIELAKLLDADRFNVFVTGTQQEGLEIRSSGIFSIPHVYDMTGRMSLTELISFVSLADVMVAASTGPLHLAAVMGKQAIGIYPPIKPMHPGRWAPIGPKATSLVKDKACSHCRKGGKCRCMMEIKPKEVFNLCNY